MSYNTYPEARAESQHSWRSIARGIWSRPQELPGVASFLDKQIQAAFPQYVNPDRGPLVLAWSVRVDLPKEPRLYYWEPRSPEDLGADEIQPYEQGIHILTEYATNYVTKLLLEQSLDIPVIREIVSGYGKLMDNFSYASFHKDTYTIMERIEHTATENGNNYQDALLTALFQHDFSPMNTLIAEATIDDCHDITQLAIHLGRKETNTSLMTNLDASMQIKEDDHEMARQMKATIRSLWLAGLARTPGVIEVCLGTSIFTAIEAFAASVHTDPTDLKKAFLLGTTAFTAVNLLVLFSLFHEAIHEFSASDEFFGFQPVSLKRRDRRYEAS